MVFSVCAQNENTKWYFGVKYGLDFMTNPPTAITTSTMHSLEGSASIADSFGNLLFYTDGDTVWDKTHNIMANGLGIGNINQGGNWFQPAIILKQPGSASIYYIFVPMGNARYSVVDMSLASGNGSVITKGVSLNYSGRDQITATKDCNGTDYWVVMQNGGFTNGNIAAFPFTANGVGTPVISPTAFQGYSGCMKFSQDGTKLAVATASLRVYDFDRSTGIASSSFMLSASQGYGCEFSPSGTILYASFGGQQGKISQFDLCAGTQSAIIASETILLSGSMFPCLQYAPDGKIYAGRLTTNSISVINSPDILGSGCNLVSTPFTTQEGFPTMMTFSQPPKPNLAPFTFTIQTINCQKKIAFTSPVLTCTQVGYSIMGVQWNFGDPVSGPANTSTLTSPGHTYAVPGTYTTQLIVNYSCGGISDTLIQPVTIPGPTLNITTHTITCANLGSATVTANGGAGPYTYTWLPSAQISSVAINLVPGNHSVTLSDIGSGCTYTYNLTLPPLTPFIGTLSASSSLMCHGASNGTAAINNVSGGSGNHTYNWSNGTSIFSSNPITTLYAGTWSVTVTDALTACKINSVFTITQPPALSLTVSSAAPSLCVGQSTTFSTQTQGGIAPYFYLWSNGPTTATQNVIAINSGITIYTLNVYDSHSCTINNTVSLDFIPNPTLSVINASICPLQTGTLTVIGASNYTWSTGSNNNSITDNPLASTLYTVTGEALGCISTITTAIILKPAPTLFAGSNSPVCENQNIKLQSVGIGAYSWTGPGGFISNAQNPVINTASSPNAGSYHVLLTAPNNCTAQASTTVVVKTNPTVSVNGSTVCSIQNASVFASSMPGVNYLWTGPGGYSSLIQNPVITTPAVTASGNYSVLVTNAVGCTSMAVAHLLVVSPPAPVSSLSSNSLCAQAFNGSANSITMTATGATNYTLNTPNYIVAAPDPGAPTMTLTSIPPFQNVPIVATATLYGSNGVCTTSTTLTFSIIPNPTITVSSPTPEICAGQSFTYTNFGASSYTWSGASANYTSYNNGGVVVANPSINAVFSVHGSSLGCNSASKTSSITVYPIPTIFISPAQSQICLGTSTLLTASGTSTDFYWYPNTGLSQVNGSAVLASPKKDQIYTVIGTANNCTNTAIATVSVLQLPKPVANASKQLYCANETVTLTGSGGEIYYWNGPDNLNLSGQTVSFSAFSASVGDYTLTVTNKNSCINQTKIAVNIAPLPQGNLAGPKMEACVPFCSEFYYQHPLGGKNISVSWQVQNINIASKTFSHCFTRSGDNIVVGKFADTLTKCVSIQTFVVRGLEVPVAEFNWLPEKPIEGMEDVLFINNSSGKHQEKFNWYFISNDGYSSENENTSYFFDRAGMYPVAYVVENASGCADTIVKYITIQPDFNFYIPNTFTPNGDDRNDIFVPVMRGIKFYTLMIFDRLGEKIFETSDPNKGWDGVFKGEACTQDVYGWKVSLSTIHGESKVYAGNVTLLR